MSVWINKNVLTAAFSLTCLEIRSRNEEAINSTRNRIYLLKVFYFLLYRHRYLCNDPKIHVRLRSQATRVYKCTKIRRPWFQRNYNIARDQKSDLHGMSFQSSPKINCMLITRPFAYNESLQHPTISVFLIKILFFFPLSSVHLFQRNQRSQAIEFVDTFQKSSKFKLS